MSYWERKTTFAIIGTCRYNKIVSDSKQLKRLNIVDMMKEQNPLKT